jgi:hypothetical protein
MTENLSRKGQGASLQALREKKEQLEKLRELLPGPHILLNFFVFISKIHYLLGTYSRYPKKWTLGKNHG